MTTTLPVGSAPLPVASPHFPSRLHAYVWRNWQLVPAGRLAEVVGAAPEQIIALGRAMGLSGPPAVDANVQRRSAITVIRRNWHLLPYEQLLALLGWTDQELAYSLREDDFLYIKLGSLKPHCEPLRLQPTRRHADRGRAAAIATVVRRGIRPTRLATSAIPCSALWSASPSRPSNGARAPAPPRGFHHASAPPTSRSTAIPCWMRRPAPTPTATWPAWPTPAWTACGCRPSCIGWPRFPGTPP